DIETILSDAANELLQRGGTNIYKEAVVTFERLLIKKALEINKENQALTARMLGISRNTLKAKLGKN
ncbi:MAG TPA: hypothetical protein ENH24_02720, partial [Nitrospirae bacterium]|nr:hypothetical protein [Nitrospirota bacterium]